MSTKLSEALEKAEAFMEEWGHHEHAYALWQIVQPIVAAARALLEPRFGIDRLPLYKAVDSGERINGAVIKVTYVPVTVAEQVAALIAKGGEIVESWIGGSGSGWRITVPEEGRYLIYGPIPAEGETT